jgi:DNA-3-methyladenine glycosylase II
MDSGHSFMTVGRIIVSDECVAEGAAFLASIEPRFTDVLDRIGPLPLRLRNDGFSALLNAIVGQQISVAAARSIWARLEAADMVNEERIAASSVDALRGLGLSKPKARYAYELATSQFDYNALRHDPNEIVIKKLTSILGIGRWSADIYAMFSLGRADVFATGDLALQEGTRMLFELDSRPTAKELEILVEKYSPWRSVAARLLWAYYAEMKSREGLQ